MTTPPTAAPTPVTGRPTTAVGLVTWNVQRAAAARARRQAAWLATCEHADLVVLTEVSTADGGRALMAALTEHGYSVQPREDPDSPCRVLVATRTGDIEIVPAARTEHMPHRCVAARMHLDGGTVAIVGAYVPSRGPRERRNVDKRIFQRAFSALLPALSSQLAPAGALLVAGDLNVVEPGHRPHHRVFGAWEYDFDRAFAAAGLTDAYRILHPDGVDHSWFGRSGAGYRFDHIFTDVPELLLDCRYLHTPRTTELSDHSAMAVTFALGAK